MVARTWPRSAPGLSLARSNAAASSGGVCAVTSTPISSHCGGTDCVSARNQRDDMEVDRVDHLFSGEVPLLPVAVQDLETHVDVRGSACGSACGKRMKTLGKSARSSSDPTGSRSDRPPCAQPNPGGSASGYWNRYSAGGATRAGVGAPKAGSDLDHRASAGVGDQQLRGRGGAGG